MPIHVLIDSSIYRQDQRRCKAGFQAIARLADADLIALHIPYVVLHEVATQQEADYEKHLKDITNGLNSIARMPLNASMDTEIRDIKLRIEGLSNTLRGFAEVAFTTWAQQHSAKIHQIGDEHGRAVMNAYFGGKCPFKQTKARDDIPDAFIFKTILDLIRAGESPIVIVADKRFIEKLERHEKTITYDSIDAFIASPAGQGLLRKESTARLLISLQTLTFPAFG